jgi:hypothetical protein
LDWTMQSFDVHWSFVTRAVSPSLSIRFFISYL